MNDFFAKLHGLSYELFGILIPGIVGLILFSIWWMALGDLVVYWSWGLLPALTVARMIEFGGELVSVTQISLWLPVLFVAHFVGHSLHWVARRGTSAKSDADSKRTARNLWLSLKLRLPKPHGSFDPQLEPHFQRLAGEFAPDPAKPLPWTVFFPIARVYVQQRLPSSLISMYQHKYTYHRSVATASALLFWSSGAALLGSFPTLLAAPTTEASIAPNQLALGFLTCGALFLVWSFSESYKYSWLLFGSTVVTETFTVLHHGSNNAEPRSKPTGSRP